MHLTGISHSIRGVRYNNIACWVPKFENEKKSRINSYLPLVDGEF